MSGNQVRKQKVLLILADISGYTDFLKTNNSNHLAHSEIVIGEIIESLLDEVKMPLKVSKLEGDAIFLYAVHQGNEAHWHQQTEEISQKLVVFFEAFSDKLVELSHSKLCRCNSCKNLMKLRLKIIVHSGIALIHTIGSFEELAGIDVITAHRLLKNNCKLDHYILLTEAAKKELRFANFERFAERTERYEDVGKIRTYIYQPSEPEACTVTA